jgi:hypothetical protein
LDTGSAVEYSLAVRVERADLPEVAVVTRDPGDSAISFSIGSRSGYDAIASRGFD